MTYVAYFLGYKRGVKGTTIATSPDVAPIEDTRTHTHAIVVAPSGDLVAENVKLKKDSESLKNCIISFVGLCSFV